LPPRSASRTARIQGGAAGRDRGVHLEQPVAAGPGAGVPAPAAGEAAVEVGALAPGHHFRGAARRPGTRRLEHRHQHLAVLDQHRREPAVLLLAHRKLGPVQCQVVPQLHDGVAAPERGVEALAYGLDARRIHCRGARQPVAPQHLGGHRQQRDARKAPVVAGEPGTRGLRDQQVRPRRHAGQHEDLGVGGGLEQRGQGGALELARRLLLLVPRQDQVAGAAHQHPRAGIGGQLVEPAPQELRSHRRREDRCG
jgi:hypothetical protein